MFSLLIITQKNKLYSIKYKEPNPEGNGSLFTFKNIKLFRD